MTKTKKLSAMNFACVAEAVAHFYVQGFKSFAECDGAKLMRGNYTADGFDEVMILHKGLLDVDASLIRVFN